MDCPKLQALMNQAYDRYEANNNWDRIEFVQQLRGNECFVVPLGNLNYQVENGGFSQWASNGYNDADSVMLLKFALRQINTPAALKVLSLVEQFEQMAPEPGDEDEYADWSEQESHLTHEFYSVNDQMMADAEAWLP
jgi:hypothetical protein